MSSSGILRDVNYSKINTSKNRCSSNNTVNSNNNIHKIIHHNIHNNSSGNFIDRNYLIQCPRCLRC